MIGISGNEKTVERAYLATAAESFGSDPIRILPFRRNFGRGINAAETIIAEDRAIRLSEDLARSDISLRLDMIEPVDYMKEVYSKLREHGLNGKS